jgi:hypothetical protein
VTGCFTQPLTATIADREKLIALIVNDTTPRAQYVASGGQTVFAYAFEIFEDADLLVYLTPTGSLADDASDILVLTTDYTVSNAGVTGGGDVTLIVAATSGDIITIVRDVAVARLIDYQTAGDFLASTVNDDFDKIVMMVQQQEDSLADRLMRFINTANLTGINTDLPPPGADEILKWNAAGTALEGVRLNTLDPSVVTISAFVETLLDDASADDFWTTLNTALTKPFLKQTIVEIGDWDMDTFVSISKNHGLTLADIRKVDAWVRTDDSSVLYPIWHQSAGVTDGGCYAGDTTINVSRVTGGFFDTVEFNATSFNRGFIVIDSVA